MEYCAKLLITSQVNGGICELSIRRDELLIYSAPPHVSGGSSSAFCSSSGRVPASISINICTGVCPRGITAVAVRFPLFIKPLIELVADATASLPVKSIAAEYNWVSVIPLHVIRLFRIEIKKRSRRKGR